MALANLVVNLTADTVTFQRDIGKAAQLASREIRSIGDAAATTAKMLALMFTGAVSGAAFLTKQAINNAEAMHDMSQAAGVSVEALSALAYAASFSGVSTEQLSTSLSRLNRNLMDAAAGTGEALKAFNALGINVRDADGNLKSADAVLREVAIKFSQMEDGAGKSALAIQLFGRAGAQMIPVLNQGASGLAAMRFEAEQFGQIISTEVAAAADNLNDNIDKLVKLKNSLGNAIMVAVMPAMNSFVAALVQGAKEGDKFKTTGESIAVMFSWVAKAGLGAVATVEILGNVLGAWLAMMDRAAHLDIAGVFEIKKDIGAQVDAIAQKYANLVKALDISKPMIEETVDNWDRLGNLGKGKAPELINKEQLNEQLANIRGFVDQYDAAIKTQVVLIKEAEAQGRITRIEAIAATAATEDARLQVLRWGQLQEADIYKKQGELAKTRTANIKAEGAEAQRIATEIISRAQISSFEAMEQEKAAKKAEAFNRELAQTVANIQLQALTEQELSAINLEAKQEQLNAALENKMISEEEHRRLIEELELQHQAKLGDIMAQGILARRRFEQMNLTQQAQTLVGHLAGLTASVAQHNRTMFNINKVAGIAQALVNAYVGISKTLASYPFPWNIAMAAAHAAVAFAQVNAIRSTSFQGGGGGTAPSLAGGTPATPVTPVTVPELGGATAQQGAMPVREVNIYVQGRSITREQLEEIADGLNELGDDGFPVRFKVTAVS